MGSVYISDNWVVVKITNPNEVLYKVVAGTSGGYTTGDSWRMNSGITEVEEEGNYYLFKGYSGSTYKCHKDSNVIRLNIAGVIQSLKDIANKTDGVTVEVLPPDTDWLTLL